MVKLGTKEIEFILYENMNYGFKDIRELKDLRASRIIKVGFEKTRNRGIRAKVKLSKSMRRKGKHSLYVPIKRIKKLKASR